MRQFKNMVVEYLIYAVIFSIMVFLICGKKEATVPSSTSATPLDSITVTSTDSVNQEGV